MTTWTPKAKQIEIWTAGSQPVRVFDPAVFDNSPIFDTGEAGGYWAPRTVEEEVWTPIQ